MKMNQMLAQMKAMEQTATLQPTPMPSAPGVKSSEQGDFSNVFKNAIDQVNDLQKSSAALSTSYVNGEGVDITRVMVASQKSSLAFQAMVQVRNKMVESYKDIMNMPV